MRTLREFQTTVGVPGSQFQWPVMVPAGTRCAYLSGGTGGRFVVADLGWLPRTDGAWHDAEYCGIEVPADMLVEG